MGGSIEEGTSTGRYNVRCDLRGGDFNVGVHMVGDEGRVKTTRRSRYTYV